MAIQCQLQNDEITRAPQVCLCPSNVVRRRISGRNCKRKKIIELLDTNSDSQFCSWSSKIMMRMISGRNCKRMKIWTQIQIISGRNCPIFSSLLLTIVTPSHHHHNYPHHHHVIISSSKGELFCPLSSLSHIPHYCQQALHGWFMSAPIKQSLQTKKRKIIVG